MRCILYSNRKFGIFWDGLQDKETSCQILLHMQHIKKINFVQENYLHRDKNLGFNFSKKIHNKFNVAKKFRN